MGLIFVGLFFVFLIIVIVIYFSFKTNKSYKQKINKLTEWEHQQRILNNTPTVLKWNEVTQEYDKLYLTDDVKIEIENEKQELRDKIIAEFDEKYGNEDTLTCFIKGVYYRPDNAQDEAFDLNPYDRVSLRTEPSNAYDEYAVKVMSNSKHIGYIPSEYSLEVFRTIKKKHGYYAIVIYRGINNMIVELKLYPKKGLPPE